MISPDTPVNSSQRVPDPTRVNRAIVYKGDVAAAELLRDRDGVTFRYVDSYLHGQGRSVATTLPKTTGEVRTRGGSVPAFFAGLLPEGRRLEALPTSLKTSPDDEYSMLLAIGHDCVGDVRVLAEGVELLSHTTTTFMWSPEDVSFDEILETSLAQGASSREKSISGVQDKLSDSMISLPVAKDAGGAILKLNPSGHPLIVENEAYVLDMARAAGLRVPIATLVRDRNGRSGLVVERFDRQRSKDGMVRRIAQEDAVQLANRLPADKYRMTTTEVFDVVLNVVTAKPVSAENLLRQFAFSYVVGNGDLHAKNVSVFFDPESIWSVAPAYGLVSTIPYGDDRMALDLDGRDRNLTGSTILKFGLRNKLNERVIRRMIDEITEGIEPLVDTLGTIGYSEKKTTHLQREITQRISQLRQMR
ncbi:MAG: HipA domain-containing protein [Microbacteriaceae bacterium]|nr:HipA domain-containing protein [Microbacteriaceae bacterium]